MKSTDNEDKKHAARKCAIETILKSKEGEQMLEYLAELTLSDVGTVTAGPYEMYFREGRRSVLAALLNAADLDLFVWLKIIKSKQIGTVNSLYQGE